MKFQILDNDNFCWGQFPTLAIADIMLKVLEEMYNKENFKITSL